MKKSTFILASAAMLFALAGCEKKNPAAEEKQAEGELVEKTFYATQGGKEKTSLDPATLATLWSEGDAIKVYSEAGGAGNDFTLESGAGEIAATFTGLTTPSDFYVAFYPAENAKSINGSTVTFNIPDTQTVTEAGSFDTNTVPMVGYTTDNTLAMMNVGSLFELGLKAKEGTPKVVNIELVGNNGENLAGDFEVVANVSGQPTATYSANGATTLTINCGEYESEQYKGIALNSTDYTYFYISIPASVFTAGFTAILTDSEGKTAEVTTTDDLHKGAAKITTFEAENVEFKNCRRCKYTETVTDVCGNKYNLVAIEGVFGTYLWMAENMRCNKYSDGTPIPTTEEWEYTRYEDSPITEYNPYYVDRGNYGYLYNFAAANRLTGEEAYNQTGEYDGTRQGICPDGFHIPSLRELSFGPFSISDPEKHLRTCDGWENSGSEYESDNAYCFSALPAGQADGTYITYDGSGTCFLTTDASADTFFPTYGLLPVVGRYDMDKYYAVSVRCVQDY